MAGSVGILKTATTITPATAGMAGDSPLKNADGVGGDTTKTSIATRTVINTISLETCSIVLYFPMITIPTVTRNTTTHQTGKLIAGKAAYKTDPLSPSNDDMITAVGTM